MAPSPSRFGIFDFRPTEELRPAKWDSTVVLRSTHSQRPVTATLRCFQSMSALPPKADIDSANRDVRFVPKADILRAENRDRAVNRRGHTVQHSITYSWAAH